MRIYKKVGLVLAGLLLLQIHPISASASELVVAQDYAGAYSRSSFNLWIDANKNGCDTRAEVLIAEATVKPKTGKKCALTGGKWLSPYDNKVITKISDLDIDHLVPLAEAWRSGAWAWTSAQRQAFANDLTESRALVAVTLGLNRSKGDKDVANWLPKVNTCQYFESWIIVKKKYALTVDSIEATRLNVAIKECNLNSPLLGQVTPAPTVTPTLIPTESSTPQPRLLTPTISIQDDNWAEIFIPGYASGMTNTTPIRAALSKINKDERGTVFLSGNCRLNSKVGPEWRNGTDLPVTPINIYCLIRNDIEFDVFAYTFVGESRVDSEKVSMRVGNPSNLIPTPAPTATANQAPTVSPGAFCAPAGATGKSAAGVTYTCKTSPTDTRNRWRQ